jgi:hypothetical protein
VVPTGVFLEELHEPTIPKALPKANRADVSSQEDPPPKDNITESPEVMEIHSACHTPFRVYLRTGGLREDVAESE